MAKQSDSSRQSQPSRFSSSREQTRAAKRQQSSQSGTSQLESVEIVSGRWLVKAIIAALIAAGVALYLTVCLLFYQGQWQFVFSLHRSAPVNAATVASETGMPIQDIKFDYTEEGIARLDGWWIPAASTSGPSKSLVVLFCPNGRSTLPQNIDALRAFHTLGVSIFAFDYRGLGASQPGHPSQKKAYEDGVAALRYLTNMQHIHPSRIVVYGAETGSAIASHVAQRSPGIAGLILENPQPSLTKQVKREQHIHLLPMWLVFTDNFDISGIVPGLQMPKLIIAAPSKPEYPAGVEEIYKQAANPKQKVDVDGDGVKGLYTQQAWSLAIQEFLGKLDTASH